MAKARQAREWDRAASIIAMVANAGRQFRRPLARLEDFHPYRERPRRSIAEAIRGRTADGGVKFEKVSTTVNESAGT